MHSTQALLSAQSHIVGPLPTDSPADTLKLAPGASSVSHMIRQTEATSHEQGHIALSLPNFHPDLVLSE